MWCTQRSVVVGYTRMVAYEVQMQRLPITQHPSVRCTIAAWNDPPVMPTALDCRLIMTVCALQNIAVALCDTLHDCVCARNVATLGNQKKSEVVASCTSEVCVRARQAKALLTHGCGVAKTASHSLLHTCFPAACTTGTHLSASPNVFTCSCTRGICSARTTSMAMAMTSASAVGSCAPTNSTPTTPYTGKAPPFRAYENALRT